VKAVAWNNRSRAFLVLIRKQNLRFPYARCVPAPSAADPVARVAIDPEIGRDGFVYTLASGREGTVHAEQVLDYNRDPDYLRDLLLYRLTVEARARVAASDLSRRELIRRLGTSATQFYRLLDQTNYRKSVDQMLALLGVLDCEVEMVVRDRGTMAPRS
jgi:hypothetical protein